MSRSISVKVGRLPGGGAFQRSVSDTVSGTDALVGAIDAVRVFNDGLGLTDSVSKVLVLGGSGGNQFGGNFGGNF